MVVVVEAVMADAVWSPVMGADNEKTTKTARMSSLAPGGGSHLHEVLLAGRLQVQQTADAKGLLKLFDRSTIIILVADRLTKSEVRLLQRQSRAKQRRIVPPGSPATSRCDAMFPLF